MNGLDAIWIVSIWVTLPDIPRHYYDSTSMKKTLEPLDALIALDKVTLSGTKPTTTNARVEIELTRPRLNEVEVALIEALGELNSFLQLINVPNLYFLLQDARAFGCPLQAATS